MAASSPEANAPQLKMDFLHLTIIGAKGRCLIRLRRTTPQNFATQNLCIL